MPNHLYHVDKILTSPPASFTFRSGRTNSNFTRWFRLRKDRSQLVIVHHLRPNQHKSKFHPRIIIGDHHTIYNIQWNILQLKSAIGFWRRNFSVSENT